MPAYCCDYACNNRAGTEKSIEKKISFHSFTLNDEKLLKLWPHKIKRDSFEPTCYSRLCSEHFEESCFKYELFTGRPFLNVGAVHTIFAFSATTSERKRTSYQFRIPSTSTEEVQSKLHDAEAKTADDLISILLEENSNLQGECKKLEAELHQHIPHFEIKEKVFIFPFSILGKKVISVA